MVVGGAAGVVVGGVVVVGGFVLGAVAVEEEEATLAFAPDVVAPDVVAPGWEKGSPSGWSSSCRPRVGPRRRPCGTASANQ